MSIKENAKWYGVTQLWAQTNRISIKILLLCVLLCCMVSADTASFFDDGTFPKEREYETNTVVRDERIGMYSY